MFKDLIYCLRRWRLIHLIGITGLRARYARSILGQFWLSVFTLVQIAVTGLVWSIIWKMEIKQYLPYVGVGHVFYMWAAQSINESSGCLVAEARLFYNDPLPLLMAVLAHLYRQAVIFAHNIPLLVLLILYGGVKPDLIAVVGALALSAVFVALCSIIVAVWATRFRDLVQIVSLLFQVLFLITPVMWKLDFVPSDIRVYFLINPIASLLEVTRNPLLGMESSPYAIPILTVWTGFVFLFAALAYRKYRRHFIFWL
jgi:lipopolysaccharide transport system permease protein